MEATSRGARLLTTSDEESTDLTPAPTSRVTMSPTTYPLPTTGTPSPNIPSSFPTPESPPNHPDPSPEPPAPTPFPTTTPIPTEAPVNSSPTTRGVIIWLAVGAVVVLISCAGICACIFRRRARGGKSMRESGPVAQGRGATGRAGAHRNVEEGQQLGVYPGVIEELTDEKDMQVLNPAPTVNSHKTDVKPTAGDSRTSTASVSETLPINVSMSTAMNPHDSNSIRNPEMPDENAPDARQPKPGHRGHTSSNATTIPPGDSFGSDSEYPRAYVSDDGAGPCDKNKQGHARVPGLKKEPSFAVLQAVMQAAQELAQKSVVPGVVEAATLVTTLVQLFVDHERNSGTSERKLRWCRSIVLLLDRASAVLGKGETSQVEAERLLLDDVREAIDDLLQIIHAYKHRNKLKRVVTSSLFKKRQQEAEAVVNMAVCRLQMGLQVRGDEMISAVSRDVRKTLDLQRGSLEDPMSEDKALEISEARRERRQRRLDELEIADDQVQVTDELLGKGGFGTVYMADFNGRNAAAKVVPVERDTEGPAGSQDADSVRPGSVSKERSDPQAKQRKTFIRELEAMMRLRSPHTVNVYGAITSRADELVLVMELMSGGDLRTMLKAADGPLEADRARRIVGDVCAGMAFLHGKRTIHGDIKSSNVLFDGYERAKIADFGTSRWIQRTASTGLATYSMTYIPTTHMSFPWAAPEVWNNGVNSYESDVYSFGIVVWEVLSRKVPWSGEPSVEEIYRKVVLHKERPPIPEEAPDDLAEVARACWAPDATERPTFKSVVKSMKDNGWQEG